MCCLFQLVPMSLSNKYRESRKIQPVFFFLFLSRSLQTVSFQIKVDPPPVIADTGLWKQLGLLVTYAVCGSFQTIIAAMEIAQIT